MGMERKEILKVKQEQISTPIKESIHKYGNHPELLFMIIFRAIELLKELIKLLIQKQEQQKARISDLMERRNEKQEKQPAPSVTQTDNQTIPAVTQPFKAPATTTAERPLFRQDQECLSWHTIMRCDLKRLWRNLNDKTEPFIRRK